MKMVDKARHNSNTKFNFKEIFQNEYGAIDLSSIMVGIIVIGLIGGVIAATVFAVIPWAQDNAAKQQLGSIVSAQNAYMGLASDSTSTLPSGAPRNSFANSAILASAELLTENMTYCTIATNGGKDYTAFSKSASGKLFMLSNNNQKAVVASSSDIPSDCNFLSAGSVVPYIDPTPTLTTMTYRCNADNTGLTLPWKNLQGKVTWDDGTTKTFQTYDVKTANSTAFPLTGGKTYTVTLDGTFEAFTYSTKVQDQGCIRSLDHWGMNTGTTSAFRAFQGASNLTSVPANIPASLTNMSEMFVNASNLNDPDISKWDTSNVTNMSSVFYGATAFDQPLNDWDVSNVKNMTNMFYLASNFNKPLDKWQTGEVLEMKQMFSSAGKFNQNIDSWDVSQVKTMEGMFHRAYRFNEPLNNWKTDNVENLMNTFYEATDFDKPLDKWNTSKVTNMNSTFFAAPAFNQNLSGWNVASVTTHTSFTRVGYNSLYLPTFMN